MYTAIIIIIIIIKINREMHKKKTELEKIEK